MKFNNRSSAQFYRWSMFIVAIVFCASIGTAFGQQPRSEDRDSPAQVTSNKFDDDLDGSGSEYFYKFTAGPGKVTVTFDVKASGTNAGATFDLFGANSKPLISNVLVQGVDGGSERAVKSVQVSRKQEVVLRIKAIKYGDSGGTGTYQVALDGAVSFGPGAAPAGGGAVAAGGAAAGANLITGELNGTEFRATHVLKLTGPGEVTFTFTVKATDKNAGATFEIQDGSGQAIVSDILVQGVDGGSDVESKTINFVKLQNITIVVKGMKYGDAGGHGTYSVQVKGPVTVVK
jgi:hypothetical protein